MGAIFTDTILSSLVSSYRILVRPCRRADRVMPWPLIRKVVSCVCKPMSGSFPSPGKSKSLHQRAEMWAPIGVLPLERLYNNHMVVTLNPDAFCGNCGPSGGLCGEIFGVIRSTWGVCHNSVSRVNSDPHLILCNNVFVLG